MPAQQYDTKPGSSPLYTSKDAELAKRKALADLGKDTDGAFRVTLRKGTGV